MQQARSRIGRAAGVEVHGDIPLVRPGMYRQVRLRDRQHTGNPRWGEPVKYFADDLRADDLYGTPHLQPDEIQIVDATPITPIEIHEQVTASGSHGSQLPTERTS